MLDNAGLGTIAPRLAQLVRMLSSPSDGEALNAARAMGRTLAGAKCDFHDLARLIEDGAFVPFVYEPVPRPTHRPSPEPTRRPSPPKATPEPNPWPTWGMLKHSEHVAWLQAIDKCGHSFEGSTRTEFEYLRTLVIVRPHEMPTRKNINLFNRLVRSAWEKGVQI